AVSQHLRRLEQETGVTLLRRTTRRLSLTEAGEAFYEGSLAMVAAARAAHERLADLQEAPGGELRGSAPAGFAANPPVTAPPGLAATHRGPALPPCLEGHPPLPRRLFVPDEPLDLVRERIDFAITTSRPLPSSSFVRRHLADWPVVLVASPAYLGRRGAPRAP